MLKRIARGIRNHFEHKALVLMYHRVADLESDVWDLAVTPTHFEQHLQLLKQFGNVMPVAELIQNLRRKTLPKRSIAITFDDGYADNYLAAKPLLEQYQLPATFFIATATIDQDQEFWWDVLEYIFLCVNPLPSLFSYIISDCKLAFDLSAEQHLTPELQQKHYQWKAVSMPPPSQRATLFYEIWQLLKPLPYATQQEHLHHIRTWAGVAASARPNHRSMTLHHLRDLSRNKLFTLGAHTLTHPALSSHTSQFQTQELCASMQYLTQASGQEINLVAYPYGDYNNQTTAVTATIGFHAAFTTSARPITKSSDIYQLGRFQTPNFNAQDFEKYLDHWFKHQ
ncbi:polysaccharide deacetylase family protein [Hymenobacter crusticola]|uniref:NodB homology domain-containing protein n=1 Tax=Hymenobacter crusticola TaxID=1770526 RepID=A0A243W804_9BACT|nr:polysaccharide deacetylase family protein [Hymenobacter crusticola]OUJ71208.1 hypothetical protein BXP70_22265 [Hymenobacter crusticola]